MTRICSAKLRQLCLRIKLAVTQPYWVCRLRSERFNAKYKLNMPQPPRKLWEIIVPWHTRGDMRKRLEKPVTFWGSLLDACKRVLQRVRP